MRLSFSQSKINIGILRYKIDIWENYFIYEEIRNFTRFKPVFFCSKIQRSVGENREFYCEPLLKVKYKDFFVPILPARGLKKFYEITKEKDIKLFYAEFLTDALIYSLLVKRSKKPLVVNFRGFELSDPALRHFLGTIFKLSDKIIARSEFQRARLLKEGGPAGKIEVIYSGIDVDSIPFRKRAINKDRLRILSGGRFVEKKGVDVTLRFFKNFLKIYPHSRLSLIGEGPLEGEIKAFIKKWGMTSQVEIRGTMKHDDFIKELYKSDIFLLPCKTSATGDAEGIPNVLKEGMASGMPVLSTYHAGIPELIQDGFTGFLVKENDHEEIIDKLSYILRDESGRNRICREARSAVVRRFNIKHTSRQVENLFRKVLS